MKPSLALNIAAAAWLAAAPAAQALTLVEAVHVAVDRSPAVASARKQAEAFQARAEFTHHPIEPQVGVDGGVGGQNSNLFGRGNQTQLRREVGASLNQRLVDWNSTGRAVEAAGDRAAAARQDVVAAADRVAFETVQAYVSVLRAEALLAAADRNLQMHRWLLAVAKDRVEKGVLAKPRLTELEARLAPLEVERLDMEGDRDKAVGTLSALIGPPGPLVAPPPLPASAGVGPDLDLQALLAPTLDARHPLLVRAGLLEDAAQKSLDAVKRGALPTIDGNLSSRYLADAEGLAGLQWDNQALVRLHWSAFGSGQGAQAKEAEATLAAASSDKLQARRDVEVDAHTAWVQLRVVRDKLKIYEQYERTAKFSMTAGLRYFLKTTHFATDMLALADLINVRFHASQNVDGARLDEQLAQFRLLQALGRLKPTLETAYSQ